MQSKFRSLVLNLHLLLHLFLGNLLFPRGFSFLKLGVFPNAEHGTVRAASTGTVVAPRAHVARDLLLASECAGASVTRLGSNTTGVLSLRDKAGFVVDILPSE